MGSQGLSAIRPPSRRGSRVLITSPTKVMRQVQDDARRTIYRSGPGSCSVITKQVYSDKTGPRSSLEVNPWVGAWVNRARHIETSITTA